MKEVFKCITGKNVLVTGAGGFIGSHLVEKLVEIGCNVTAFVRYNSQGAIGNLDYLDDKTLKLVNIVYGDLRNYHSVLRAVEGIDVIFHLGALISIPYSYVNPCEFVDTNVLGTMNVLMAAQACKVKKTIVTSSSEVYGTALYSPIDEKHPLQAQSPYSATKISADKITESMVNSFNLPAVIVRPFNTYGPRQSIRAVIPTIIYQALTKKKIKLGSLSPKRDFNYVGDTVLGFIKAAESDLVNGETINLGSGKAISIGELVELIGELLGKKLIIEKDDSIVRPKSSEVFLLIANSDKAKKLIAWQPETPLKEGLMKVIDYVRENLDKYSKEEGNI